MLISRSARQKYQFDEKFFQPDGRARLADFSSARDFAARLSEQRTEPVPASDIQAIYLLDEVLHILLRQYDLQNPGVLRRGLVYLQSGMQSQLEATLIRFVEEFPPRAVYEGESGAADYLAGDTDSRSHRQNALEEMLLVYIANQNPALKRYEDLFSDEILRSSAPYTEVVSSLSRFLGRQPGFGGASTEGETLVDALLAPSRASPYSLEGQLKFIMDRWGFMLGEGFINRLLRSMDYIREEVIRHQGPNTFKPEVPVPTYGGIDYSEYERYSPDRDWMPRLVLMAKNSYVWLEQLSRKYGRWIQRLDQIPDEELDLLASGGFTGLWLIGLWERSKASQKIKQRMGQEDAVASAYSLHSYDIAADLGGWQALQDLRTRAWQRGLRLSADMVPNHMGIDSEWVMEHPAWFLAVDSPPYPSYTFNSADLSEDPRAGVVLEDHYYDHSDAAVVFKRFERASGDTRYLYHGNDGTSFPWNDTAQLDYSKAEVREAVIQTILHVSRNFPIIRFDAAMTLARKHIQRLWFPEPGSGGAIPSRSEHGMTKAEFDAAIPQEFWREVVDRVAAEIPDTLLLAEAFWLMEGYFVRTLGMHRVYNSAFMHMLRDEDNTKYRSAIKNTLEFDPQILRRYVNFMNNPDEKTAAEQFGNGDKYFGVATLLSTLPGLPMYGHGQIEGLREKYGMEFRKPKWDEQPDEGLVRGHEWKIFPLLHRRYLFADVEHFLLYDFFQSNGMVDENIFALSNRFGNERGLVVYHNRFAETRGWIKTSAAYLDKGSGELRQKSLAEGLECPSDGFVIFKDIVTHEEYIRSCEELWQKGLYFELGAYQCHAFLDWRFAEDERWGRIHDFLNGTGVESMQAEWEKLYAAKEEIPFSAAGAEARKTIRKKPLIKKASKKTIKKEKTGSQSEPAKPGTPSRKKGKTLKEE
jgi:glycosidase